MRTFLGIDIGTTSCKVCLIDESQQVLADFSRLHNATIQLENPAFSEQCPRKIIHTVLDMIQQLELSALEAICVSGQMHGVMLWDRNNDFKDDWLCSNFISWMDQRCDDGFLASLPVWKDTEGNQESSICTGYGMATLAWLHRNNQIRPEWNTCGSIMDFLNFLLTGKCAFMSDQLAYSFGYATVDNNWQEECESLVPTQLLPTIIASNQLLGKLNTNLDLKCSNQVDVYVALGDLQTSLYKVLRPKQAVLHIGTSSQLAFSLPIKPELSKDLQHLLCIPYFNDQCLVAATSLNGGNVLELLAKKISQFCCELAASEHKSQADNETIQRLLDEAINCQFSLKVKPLFFGERHAPNMGATLNNLCSHTSLAELFGATAEGIVENLSELMPQEFMKHWNIDELLLLNRATHPVFERASKTYFPNMHIVQDESSAISAAFGAACHACKTSLSKQ